MVLDPCVQIEESLEDVVAGQTFGNRLGMAL
jgi:hypothetical protein